jgi:flagellar hook-basal body complex protein FliE
MVSVTSNPMAAANAYASTAKTASVGGGAASEMASSGISGASFGDMLENATRSAIESMHAGEKASAGAITGKVDPLTVTQAVTNARLTLDTVVAVRDQAIDAYNRIMQMPI